MHTLPPHPASLFDATRFAQRRRALAAQLGDSGLALLPTAPERPRNRDNHHLYRHDSYFYYLSGFNEPHAWLLIDHHGHTTLFCQPKDPEREIWDGIRLGPEAAPAALGIDAAYPVSELHTRLPALLENRHTLWFPFATHEGLEGQVARWLEAVRARARAGVLCPEVQRDLCSLLDEMRLIKDEAELATVQRAAAISAAAHVRAMQTCARLVRAGQDVREYHLDAELLHTFRHHGAEHPAYGSIVAAGVNACILHYRAGSAPIRAGELVLIDAGCELDGYASDITRTFPADGRFTGPQRALYELVLAAQEAAIAATRPGARFSDPHDAAVRALTQGLLDLGLLKRDAVGSVDEAIASRAYARFYMHRTGHWLGMDVHDCGSYIEPSERDQATPLTDPASGQTLLSRPSRILRPGMVLTIEPGLYVRPAEDVPEAYWNIGIRIEDDAVLTPEGCRLLTRDVPVQPQAIEALMRE